MANKTFKEISRENWHAANGPVMNEQILVGAVQRIADATEVMAKSYQQLQNDRDRYKANWEYQKKEGERMARRISSLQGVITKMKRRANK